ncbi:MAG: hypothetical protein ABIG11_00265 [bacterium]
MNSNMHHSNQYEFDIIVYGMQIYKIEKLPYGGLYGNATRAFGLANNFAKIGFKTALVVQKGFSFQPSSCLCKSLQFIEEPEFYEIVEKSRNLVLAFTNFNSFELNFKGNPFVRHPNKFCVCCFDGSISGNLMDEIYGITFNNSIQKKLWDERKTQIPSHVVSYGVNEFGDVDEDIKEVVNNSAIWIGEIRRRDMFERIINFAVANPGCRVDVMTRKIFDRDLPPDSYGGVNRPYADFRNGDPSHRFYALAEELFGRKMPANLRYLGMQEGKNHETMGAHTIGLDFSRFPYQRHDNSKILDYLRSGLAVICDDGAPSYRYVHEFQHGRILPCKHTIEDLQKAFAACESITSCKNRRKIAQQVRERYGWDKITLKIARLMKEDEECRHLIARRRNRHHVTLRLFRLLEKIKRGEYRSLSPVFRLLQKASRNLRKFRIRDSK